MAYLPVNTAPQFPTDDPAKMAYQNWLRSQGLGDVSAQYGRDTTARYTDEEAQNRFITEQMYQDLINNPGYTEEEKQQILQDAGLRGLLPDEATLQSWGLQPGEIAGIQGDPWKRAGYFDPGYIEDLQRSGADWTKQAYGQGQGAVRTALEGGEGAVRDTLGLGRDRTMESVRGMETGVRGAVGEYGTNLRGALAGMGTDVRGALGDYGSRLRGAVAGARTDVLSPYDNPELVTSPEEVQALKDRAARGIGAGYAAAKEDLVRRAEASGNVNPLSLAAARQRLERGSAVGREDAMTDAMLAGSAQRRRDLQALAEARSSGGRFLSTLGTGAESELGQAGVGTEKYLGGAGMEAESELGRTGVGAETTLGQARTGAEQYFTGLGTSSALTLGGRRAAAEELQQGRGMDMAQNLSTEAQRNAQWNQQFGTDVMRDVESQEQARANQIALNRQATAQAAQAAKLQAGMNVYPQLSRAATTTANARRADLGEARNWSTRAQRWAGEQGSNAYDQYLRGQQIALGGQQAATGTAADIWRAKNASSFKNSVLYPTLKSWMSPEGVQQGMGMTGLGRNPYDQRGKNKGTGEVY